MGLARVNRGTGIDMKEPMQTGARLGCTEQAGGSTLRPDETSGPNRGGRWCRHGGRLAREVLGVPAEGARAPITEAGTPTGQTWLHMAWETYRAELSPY
jgi:hypothetical protein